MSTHPPETPTPDVATDHRGLRVLGMEECLERIRQAPVGRVGFAADGEVTVLPVTHILDGLDVVFRTTWGSKLQVAADVGRVAFEVDGLGEEPQTGWSVLVQGNATVVDDQRDQRRFERAAPPPWVRDGGPSYWVRVRPSQITGREILSRSPGTA